MTIKVTLEYNSVDEAIVALGKLIGAPVAPVKERKGRADAGQKRGEYKPRETKGAPASATPSQGDTGGNTQTGVSDPAKAGEAATPQSTVLDAPKGPAPQAPATATTAGAPPSTPAETIGDKDGDAQAAIAKVYAEKSMDAVRVLLADFGVNRVRDVPKAKRDDFLKAAAQAAA
jgi:hypothetical protein